MRSISLRRIYSHFALVAVFGLLLTSFPVLAAESEAASLAADREEFKELRDPALSFLESPQFRPLLRGETQNADKSLLDRVFRIDHNVPIGPGQTLRLYEYFTIRSWLTWPRRAVFMPSSFKGSSWAAPVEGYNGAEIVARRGFFAFTVDFVGTGESYRPENGLDVTFQKHIDSQEIAIRYIRAIRWVPKVDILGEGYGASVATQLAADAHRVRSVVLVSNLYREQIGGPASDPSFIEFLLSIPDGYVYVPAETSAIFYQGSPPEFQAYFNATQADFFPVMSFLIAAELPFFDPGVARVPGKVIQGEFDNVAAPNDPFELANDYGLNGAELVILPGVGRSPRMETPEAAAAFWEEVFDFLDP